MIRRIIMGTFTAQILIGKNHPYDGGIHSITHTLFLSENSRPTWVLKNEGAKKKDSIIWITTVENMLEDGLLMLGVYVLKDEKLLKMKEKYFLNKSEKY